MCVANLPGAAQSSMDGTLPGFGTEAENDGLESHFCQASMLMFAQLMLCLSAAEPYYRKKITYAAAAAPRRCSRRGKLMGEEEAPVSEGEGPMDEEERERDGGAPVGDAARGVPSQTYTIWAQPNDAGVNQRLKAWCRGPY